MRENPYIPPLRDLSWLTYLQNVKFYWVAFLIFVLGELISLFFFKLNQQSEDIRMRTEFNRLADIRTFFIKQALKDTFDQIDYVQQFYYSSGNLSEEMFKTFTSHILKNSNLLALGWMSLENEPLSLLTRDQQNSSQLNFASLSPLPPSIAHQIFFTYLNESKSNVKLYISNRFFYHFLETLQKSQFTQAFTVSSVTDILKQERKKAFFIFTPLYLYPSQTELNTTSHIKGVLVGIADLFSLVQNVESKMDATAVNLMIYDETDQNKLIYATPLQSAEIKLVSSQKNQQQQWSKDYPIQVGDHLWRIKIFPSATFMDTKNHFFSWMILLGGFLTSAVTAGYFLVMVNRRMLIEEEVWKRTEELADINQILQQEIQERKRIEEEVIKDQHHLQKRHEALEYLTKFTTSELKNGLQEVVLRTAVVMQIERVSVWLYDNSKDHTHFLSCSSLYNLSTNTFSENLTLKLDELPHYFHALTSHSHLIIPATETGINKELASYLSCFHILSKLDVPIIFEGKFLGILCCEETREVRNWKLEDRHFGQTIADVIALMIEQANRRQAEKALQESEEKLRFITQKAIDAIISVTDTGEIVSWNYGAERLFSYSEKEILGSSLSLIISNPEIVNNASNKQVELQGQTKANVLFPIEVSSTRWKSGTNYFDTLVIRDITERKEYEEKLINAMKEAKAANEAKSEFLTTISHELRTPLNAIIGFNQCLLLEMDGPINDRQKSSLKKVEKSSFHLLNLINDVLDLAKIEANKLELDIALTNILDTIISSVEEMQPMALQKHLDLDLFFSQTPILIHIDRMRIKQVLLNLLSNAIKFTEKGFVHVSVINEAEYVEIRVQDTGIGLNEQEMKKLFKSFSQADSSITRRYGGTGLGLIISKKIVNMHQGQLWAESKKHEGSTFIITLPK